MERHTTSYLQLIKPGITLSNTLATVAGAFLATSIVGFQWTALLAVIAGVALVIASACVFNNIIDRDIDKKMKRTVRREVAKGSINVPHATAYLVALGLAGFALLFFFTNLLTVVLGIIAYVWYVGIYGYAKRTTAYSTLIGGVPGALPPVAGYTALTGSLDLATLALFAILFFWQLPHFYAIAMFRRDDYKNAGLPVWSVRYGMTSTKNQLFITVVLYALSAGLLTLFGYTGIIYLVLSSVLSIYWIYKGVALYNKGDDVKWAKAMFGISLLVLLAMVVLISVGGFLP